MAEQSLCRLPIFMRVKNVLVYVTITSAPKIGLVVGFFHFSVELTILLILLTIPCVDSLEIIRSIFFIFIFNRAEKVVLVGSAEDIASVGNRNQNIFCLT